MGPQHGRILQAYFNGANLIIKYSRLYDFRQKNVEALKLFARWALCEPQGTSIQLERPEPLTTVGYIGVESLIQ